MSYPMGNLMKTKINSAKIECKMFLSLQFPAQLWEHLGSPLSGSLLNQRRHEGAAALPQSPTSMCWVSKALPGGCSIQN